MAGIASASCSRSSGRTLSRNEVSVTSSSAKDQGRQLKRQYKHARKLAKEAKRRAAQAEESVQQQQKLLTKAQKKLLKARKAAKQPEVAIVRKPANTNAASSALAKHKAQVPQTQPESVLPPRTTPAGNVPQISA